MSQQEAFGMALWVDKRLKALPWQAHTWHQLVADKTCWGAEAFWMEEGSHSGALPWGLHIRMVVG